MATAEKINLTNEAEAPQVKDTNRLLFLRSRNKTMDAEERLWAQLDRLENRLLTHAEENRDAHEKIYIFIRETQDGHQKTREEVVAHKQRWLIFGSVLTIIGTIAIGSAIKLLSG
jgi:hypothetical protein